VIKNRSSAPDTCRQSSSAYTSSPVDRRDRVRALWVSAARTIMISSTSFPLRMLEARQTGLACDAATHL